MANETYVEHHGPRPNGEPGPNGRIALHDIDDCEAFVIDAWRRTRIRLDRIDEELVAEGLAVLWRMGIKFDGRGRFSGYAAKYLPGKLIDAWHGQHENHVSVRAAGQRSVEILDPALSLQGLFYNRGSEDGDHGPANGYRDEDAIVELAGDDPRRLIELGGPRVIGRAMAEATSALIRRMHSALRARLDDEIDFTVKVGILKGMDLQRSQIQTALDASEWEVRAALERLKRIADDEDLKT